MVCSPAVLKSVEILDLRHYTSQELRPLLAAESQVWADELSWDYRSSVEMILRYVDSKILPGYVALENGAIAGYAFFVYEGSKGVVGDMYVDRQLAGPQLEAVQFKLLTHVIETLTETPGIHRVEAQLLAHPSGEMREPFDAAGFRVHQRLFMDLALGNAAKPKLVTSGANAASIRGVTTATSKNHAATNASQTADTAPLAGGFYDDAEFEFRFWRETDFQHASQLITAAYAGHVDSTINDQYRTTAGSMRFLNNIVRFPGCGIFDGEASFVVTQRATGRMVGLLLTSRVRDEVGHVTQVCLLPEFRGLGLGRELIAAATETLTRRGFKSLTLTVTEANRSAVELYKQLGFTTRRVFDAFVWEG